jgi:hypothetical protein
VAGLIVRHEIPIEFPMIIVKFLMLILKLFMVLALTSFTYICRREEKAIMNEWAEVSS